VPLMSMHKQRMKKSALEPQTSKKNVRKRLRKTLKEGKKPLGETGRGPIGAERVPAYQDVVRKGKTVEKPLERSGKGKEKCCDGSYGETDAQRGDERERFIETKK